jgi:lipoprotein-anchoring transpeptidase ErfK/SrfK
MLKNIAYASLLVSTSALAQNWLPIEQPRAAYRAEKYQSIQQQRSLPHYQQATPQRAMGGGLIEAIFGGSPAPAPIQYAQPVQQPRYAALALPQAVRPIPEASAQSFDDKFTPQQVRYDTPHAPGTVIIDTNSKFLHLVMENGQAMRYGVGVGRPGFTWKGVKTISRKAEWPDWRPPAQMLLRRPDLPKYMAGGESNPLGARAMYLGSSLYRIHGTNEPHTIGHSVSSGCFRMRNEDVTDLYSRVRVGTKVVVL